MARAANNLLDLNSFTQITCCYKPASQTWRQQNGQIHNVSTDAQQDYERHAVGVYV